MDISDERPRAVDLEELIARQQITDVLHRYCRAVDRRDGQWRIAHRHVVYDWGRIERATHGWWDTLPGNWSFGSRDREDPDDTEGPWPWPRPEATT